MGFDMGFGMGFGMFNIMFFLIFGVVIVMFIVTAVKGISTWNKNNNSPRLTVEATVSSKRQNVDVHHHNTGDNNAMHTTTSTTYYVTFQVASGDRRGSKAAYYDRPENGEDRQRASWDPER